MIEKIHIPLDNLNKLKVGLTTCIYYNSPIYKTNREQHYYGIFTSFDENIIKLEYMNIDIKSVTKIFQEKYYSEYDN